MDNVDLILINGKVLTVKQPATDLFSTFTMTYRGLVDVCFWGVAQVDKFDYLPDGDRTPNRSRNQFHSPFCPGLGVKRRGLWACFE